jgi:hypothetical protein
LPPLPFLRRVGEGELDGPTSQNTRNLARMARDGDVGAGISQKHVVDHLLAADILVGVGLAVQRLPQACRSPR